MRVYQSEHRPARQDRWQDWLFGVGFLAGTSSIVGTVAWYLLPGVLP